MHVLPRLHALRHDIETYRFLMREGRRIEVDGVTVRVALSDTAMRTPASVTVSIGVAEKSLRLATPADVLNAADAALYRAKAEGRNRVCR
jgi:diguanylate cyclase (GGDEF)-like protein